MDLKTRHFTSYLIFTPSHLLTHSNRTTDHLKAVKCAINTIPTSIQIVLFHWQCNLQCKWARGALKIGPTWADHEQWKSFHALSIGNYSLIRYCTSGPRNPCDAIGNTHVKSWISHSRQSKNVQVKFYDSVMKWWDTKRKKMNSGPLVRVTFWMFVIILLHTSVNYQ